MFLAAHKVLFSNALQKRLSGVKIFEILRDKFKSNNQMRHVAISISTFQRRSLSCLSGNGLARQARLQACRGWKSLAFIAIKKF